MHDHEALFFVVELEFTAFFLICIVLCNSGEAVDVMTSERLSPRDCKLLFPLPFAI